ESRPVRVEQCSEGSQRATRGRQRRRHGRRSRLHHPAEGSESGARRVPRRHLPGLRRMAGNGSHRDTGARLRDRVVWSQRRFPPAGRCHRHRGHHLLFLSCAMRAHYPTRPRGYSIIELMVAITIGLIILAALVTLFAGNSRQRGEIERANQQTENGRYALELIGEDLRDAGYLASFNPGTVAGPNPQLVIPTALPNACATDVPTLNSAVSITVQGYDNGANAPACIPDLRPGTDILVVRRASTCAVGTVGCDAQVGGDVYLQASGCPAEFTAGTYYVLDSNVANLTLRQKDCATAAQIYQFRTHIYFVANDDKAGDGIPTLKRAELGPGAFAIVPLVEGVDSLQLEYGLDTTTPTTGSPAVYTADPSSYNGCAP